MEVIIMNDYKNKENKSWIDRNFKKVMVVLVVILIMSVGLYVTSDQPQHNSTINLADEINGHNWVLFTMSNCPACVEQKKILGNHSDNIIIVTCDTSQHSYDICQSYNIQRVPTWVNIKTSQRVEGYQTLENIEVMLDE